MPPQVGQAFPPIQLLAAGDRVVRVPEEFHGRKVVLSFYPFAFSPVCTEEFTGFTSLHGDFERLGAEVVPVSCDHWYTTEAYRQALGSGFPFLSDWTKAASRRLGVLDEARGRPERAIFVLDREGVLRWQRIYPVRHCPSADDFLPTLKALA